MHALFIRNAFFNSVSVLLNFFDVTWVLPNIYKHHQVLFIFIFNFITINHVISLKQTYFFFYAFFRTRSTIFR